MMKTTFHAASMGLLCFAAAACHEPSGRWSLASVEPTAARRHVEFHSLTLHEDGTFYAEAREGAGIESVSGTYVLDDGALILTAHDGEIHGFDARIRDGGNKLYLTNFQNGQRVNLKYGRRERARLVRHDD